MHRKIILFLLFIPFSMTLLSTSLLANNDSEYTELIYESQTYGSVKVMVTLKTGNSSSMRVRKSEIKKLQTNVIEKLNPDDIFAYMLSQYAPVILIKLNANGLQKIIELPEVEDISNIGSIPILE